MKQTTGNLAVKAFIPGWVWSAMVVVWLLGAGYGDGATAFGAPAALRDGGLVVFSLPALVCLVLVVLATIRSVAAVFLHPVLPSVASPGRVVPAILDTVSGWSVIAVGLFMAAADLAGVSVIGWMGFGTAVIWSFAGVDRVAKAFGSGHDARGAGGVTGGSVSTKLRGIQGKLTLSFASLILVVVVVLTSSLLGDFGSTLLGAIMDSGTALADRTASIVKTNIGDRIALEDYLSIEARKNGDATFPFSAVSYFKLDPKTGAYAVEASTDPGRLGSAPEISDAPFDAPAVIERETDIEFRAPVVLSGKLIGFASVGYDSATIYGPYYRTRTKALIISFIFLYVSVIVTYLFGRGIVMPILFLRSGVNAIASRLSAMVRGEERISAERLQYSDAVRSRDEIKELSIEIGNMATVIRGVVPYISASTLRNSEKGRPSTERRDMAFLFTDIRGFTTMCEGLSPEEVVAVLNKYLDLQTQAIIDNGGDVDKFVGDEMMAAFDGPDKELRACRAGMTIRKAMAEAQEQARAVSGAMVSIGLGINTGPVVFGSVGARERMDFTSIGDTVNLAARLEGANKTYGTKSLITEAVWEHVRDTYLCREIDMIAVKGKNQPVRIFEILQEKSRAASKLVEIKDGFEAGLAAYRQRDWQGAKALFAKVADGYNDEAARIFMRRLDIFQANPPPADWDGVFRMTVK